MTKAAICVACSDIFSPRRDWRDNHAWTWCQCGHAGVRWENGERGLIQVTASAGPGGVRILGLNNTFLGQALAQPPAGADGWVLMHESSCLTVGPEYLFHAGRRACWAVVARPGDSADITFIPWAQIPRQAGPPPMEAYDSDGPPESPGGDSPV